MMKDNKITIDLEEYKELLIIKGRYEELIKKTFIPTITYIDGKPIPKEYDTYKITCNVGEEKVGSDNNDRGMENNR